MSTLREVLNQHVREGELYEPIDRNRIRCFACGHCCPILEGQPGVCKVRYNQGGKLYVPWGYVGGVQCDPIEKKPFFHAYPGALAYSFGMLGCDLHCSYCQNWVTSQALRDPHAVSPPLQASPELLVKDALRLGAKVLVSTYNEPLITAEWAVAIFKEARAAGLKTAFVSNGNGTPQVLEYIRPWIDFYKVDLKSFDDRHYRQLGGRIGPILDTIRGLHGMGVWLEIVTLLIPGFNDSNDELRRLSEFVAGVSPNIPWHVTAFHKDYRPTVCARLQKRLRYYRVTFGVPQINFLRLPLWCACSRPDIWQCLCKVIQRSAAGTLSFTACFRRQDCSRTKLPRELPASGFR